MLGVTAFVRFSSAVLVIVLLIGCGGDGLNREDNQAPPGEEPPPPNPISTIGETFELSNANTKAFRAETDNLKDASVWVAWLEDNGSHDQLMIRRYLSKNYQWDVSAIRLDNGNGDTSLAQLAIDPVGRMMAVWTQINDQGRSELQARYYNKYQGRWREMEVIDSQAMGDSDSPRVVVSNAGQVTVIWRQLDGDVWRLMGSYYLPMLSQWTTPEMIDGGTGSVDQIRLLIDANGTATALWHEFDGSSVDNLWAVRRSAGSGWDGAMQLSSGVVSAKMAVDIGGVAIVSWLQGDVAKPDLRVARYEITPGVWVTEALEASDFGVFDYDLVVTPNTDVTVAWIQSNGLVEQLWVSRYQNNAWQPSQALSDATNPATEFLLQADSKNKTTLVWRENASSGQSLWSQNYRSGWHSKVRIDGGVGGAELSNVSMVVDHLGNTTVAWLSGAGQYHDIWVNRFSAVASWGNATALDVLHDGDAIDPRLLINAAGDVTAVWTQDDKGVSQLLTARYPINVRSWSDIDKVDQKESDDRLSLDVIINGTGEVTSFWQQESDVGKGLWSSRF